METAINWIGKEGILGLFLVAFGVLMVHQIMETRKIIKDPNHPLCIRFRRHWGLDKPGDYAKMREGDIVYIVHRATGLGWRYHINEARAQAEYEADRMARRRLLMWLLRKNKTMRAR